MPVSAADQKVVDRVVDAMHARDEKKFMPLFAENAVLKEPFSGTLRTHTGSSAIREWFQGAVAEMPPDMKIKMDRIDMDGPRVKADWTCTSSVFSTPMRGSDYYNIRNGLIEHAEFVVTEMPPMGP